MINATPKITKASSLILMFILGVLFSSAYISSISYAEFKPGENVGPSVTAPPDSTEGSLENSASPNPTITPETEHIQSNETSSTDSSLSPENYSHRPNEDTAYTKNKETITNLLPWIIAGGAIIIVALAAWFIKRRITRV